MNFGDIYSYKIEVSANTAQGDQAVQTIKAVGKATEGAAATSKIYTDAAGRLRDELGKFVRMSELTEDQLKQLGISAERAAASIGKAGKEAGRGGPGGRGLLEFAQFVDDAQYGLRGVMNQIPQMVMAIGGGAGIAGAVSIAVVAMDQLLKRAPALMAMFTPEVILTYGDTVETLKGKLDDLTAKEYALVVDSTAVDAARDKLDEATEALKRFEAISKQTTSLQAESAKRVGEAIAEFGGGDANTTGGENLNRAIRDLLLDDPKARAERDAAQAAIAATTAKRSLLPVNAGPDMILAANRAVAQAEAGARQTADRQRGQATSRAGEMIGQAGLGDEAAIIALRRMLDQNAQFFRGRGVDPALGAGLEGARPQAIAQARREEEQRKREEEFWKEEERRQREAEAERKRREAEDARARQEERRERARADTAEDARFGQVRDAFTPAADAIEEAGQAQGQAADAIADQVYQMARSGGASIADALRLAEETFADMTREQTAAINEFAAKVQAANAEAARAREMARQSLLIHRSQNPYRNNRSGYP